MAVIPKLPTIYDEPFADSSQIPTYIVSNLARKNVTVALSGDGGDELFAGYNRYIYGASLWSKLAYTPHPLRKVVSSALQAISPAAWNRMTKACATFIPREFQAGQAGEKLHKLAGVMDARTETEFIQLLLENGNLPEKLLLGNWHLPDNDMTISMPDTLNILAERAMFNDTIQYLPDDILTKVDRASMGVSLEVRAPFLDKSIFNFAWSLPLQMKLCNGKGKYLLRQVLNRYIPQEIIDRPKHGFAVPIGRWLRSDLKDWSESLLNHERLKDQGYLDPDMVKNLWNAHLSGRVNYDTRLWSILMFQAWLDKTH